MSLADFYYHLHQTSAAVREAMKDGEAERLTFVYDPDGPCQGCFAAFVPEKLNSTKAVHKLMGGAPLPFNGIEEEKGYQHDIVFRCVEDPERWIRIYDRWGQWRLSGDAETLAAFEVWASGVLECDS